MLNTGSIVLLIHRQLKIRWYQTGVYQIVSLLFTKVNFRHDLLLCLMNRVVILFSFPYSYVYFLIVKRTSANSKNETKNKPMLAHKQSTYATPRDADCIASSIRDTRNATSRALAGDKANIASQTDGDRRPVSGKFIGRNALLLITTYSSLSNSRVSKYWRK